MNYQPVVAENQPNDNACIKENLDAGKVGKETVSTQQYVLLPLWSTGLQDPQNTDANVVDAAFDVKENENDLYVSAYGSDKSDNKKHDEKAKRDDKGKNPVDLPIGVRDWRAKFKEFSSNSTNRMDVKRAFLYGTIKEEVYVCQPPRFEDPDYPDKVYKVVKALYRLHQASRTCQDKYVAKILRKFHFIDVKSASTLIETKKPLLKDPDGEDTVVATSSTKAEYVAAASCCAQVLWIQNQLLDYGKELASLKQMALGKDILNLFMDGSLPKTICEGFDQILDFLNAHTIQYAIVVNPTIYVSCIKQFWATANIKKVNGVVQLRALIDGKKVVVLEDVLRRDLYLYDADECLSAKRTVWNKFSCSMASAVIYLATGRKFNFFKYIFDSMVRNVDSPSKFLMYQCFLQVKMDNQLDDLTSHNTKYTSPNLTQKVFANMRRVGKGFLGVETPLFALMLVQPQPEAAEEEEEEVKMHIAPATPSLISAPLPPPHALTPTPHTSPPQEQPTTTSDSSMSLLTTLIETCSSLSQKGKEVGKEKEIKVFRVQEAEKETQEEVITMDAEPQGRINQKDVNAINKRVSVVEPTVFDDEEIAQKLHDEEVQKATAMDKQENNDMKRAQDQDLFKSKDPQARSTPIHDLGVIYESYDHLFTLKIHRSGNFTSLSDRGYHYAVIEWYDLVYSKRVSICGFDAMLKDLGIKGVSFLFSYFMIPGKSLDEGLVPLISYQDVLSLLKYVPRYKQIEMYVENHTMKVVFGKGKGVVIEEIVEDDEVNKAGETGYRGQSLLLDENDVQTGNMGSTSKHKWVRRGLKKWNNNDDLLQQVDPYDWQHDPYHEDDEVDENIELFAELDDLLKHLPFLNDKLKENVVGVDALVVAVEEQLERIEHVVDEEIERPRKRERENKDESASANVLPFKKMKQKEKVESS
nr:hypothetical protein [Tanacetum cinerariifolium]